MHTFGSRKGKSRLNGKNGKDAIFLAICHTIATIMTQTGVNFKLVVSSKDFYLANEEAAILAENAHVAETADKGLKLYSTFQVCKQTFYVEVVLKIQKQPPKVFYKNRCSSKFLKIHRKTPVSEFLF